jgi:zeaxanthin glucosyltransferase
VVPSVSSHRALSTSAPALRNLEPGSAIYVTLGSILGEVWPDAFVRVLQTVGGLRKTVVVTVGHRGDCQALASLFPAVHVANYIPQRFILDRAALVVCHGGINTLLGAVSCGVPVLVLPSEHPTRGATASGAGNLAWV